MWCHDAVPNPAPPAPDDPLQLGPFVLRGRWSHDETGTVYQALAPDGLPVGLLALGPGPSRDAAARDRFAAAVSTGATSGPGRVLAADTGGPWPWVALPAGHGQPPDHDTVSRLLGAVTPSVHLGAVPRGPSFSPHWVGQPRMAPASASAAAAPIPPVAPPPGRRALWTLLAVAGGLLVVLLVALAALTRSDDPPDPFARPATPTPSPSAPAQPSPSAPTQPSPSAPTQPSPSAPLQPGPGVAGPSFTAEDDTREMRLAGLPFPFRTPATWTCEREAAAPPVVRWACVDVEWLTQGREGAPPGGAIEVQPCPAPCDDMQWELLRDRYAPQANWQFVDVTTAASQDVDEVSGYERIRMSHVFAAPPGDVPDTHVFVDMSGPTELADDVRRVVNDIRANTP